MKDSELYSKDELETFEKIENEEFEKLSLDDLESRKKQFKKVATDTIKKKTKKKSLNIRLIEEDILKIKAIALKEGIPYQTYISSMIHKIANREIA